jgi:hypothetical protein
MSSSTSDTAATLALRSTDFLNSIGVNIHIGAGTEGNAYTNTANIVADLSYLGITHVRDNIYPVGAGNATFEAAYSTLARAGVKFDLTVGSSNSDLAAAMAGIDAFAQADPGAISAIEGPNEINNFPFSYDGETGQNAAIAFQTALYSAVQADPNLVGVPVYDFTGGSTNEPVAGLADYANIHVYPWNGDQPAWYITASSTAEYGDAAPLPEVITEAGYNTDIAATSGVSLDAQAKMTLNLLMDSAKDGVSETYLYELLDEYPDPNNLNSGNDWGLFSGSNSPLPVAQAIHDLNSILSDVGAGASTFTPGALSYTISNLPWTGNSLLLEKSTGTFDLVVWNEPPIWNSATETEDVVAPTTTTVNLGSTYASIEVFDPLVGTSPIQTLSNVSTVELSLTDHPLIIEVEAPATVSVTVDAPPSAAADSGVTEQNQPVTIAVLAGDTDSAGTINPGSVAVSTAAAYGTTSVNTTTGAITYTPAAGYSGADTFQYTVANTLGGVSAPATVSVAVDAPPSAAADSATTPQNQPVTIAVLANDTDSVGTINPGSVAVSTAAAHGTTAINPTTGAIVYTPAAGYTGSDTFQYTVANTLGGVSAPATVSLTVNAPSGGGSGLPPPPDGSGGALPGAPELPNLFSGYAVRPQWKVAGVDHAAGMPNGTSLLDPSPISMHGVKVNATTHIVSVSDSNVTLNGYDFSLNGGWQVHVTGSNDTIENSNFKVGANELIPIAAARAATNLSVLYNTVDGGGAYGTPSAISALISDTGTGLTVEYNWLQNVPQAVIAVKGGALIDEYNLIQNVGFGATSAESDLKFTGGVSNNSVISFNTLYNPPHAGGPTQLAAGLQIEAQNGGTLFNTQVENNTIISPGPTPTNTYLIEIRQDFGPNIVNGVNIQDNYTDSTGANAAYFPTTTASNVAFVDNINLKTGSIVPGIPGTASTPWGP